MARSALLRSTVAVVLGSSLYALVALAADTPPAEHRDSGSFKQDAKDVGSDVKDAAKHVGHATARGVKKAAKATAKGVKKAGHAVEHAAETTEEKIKRSE